MKKKGLIISTVVMAVVLIASLTTATYAWFSSSAATTVDQMTIKVEPSSDAVIGIAKNANAFKSSRLDNDFYNGTVLMGAQYGTTGTETLGTQLTIQFGESSKASTDISLNKAVATSTDSGYTTLTKNSGTAVFSPSGNTIFTAQSSESGSTQEAKDKYYSLSGAKDAVGNTDYIYLPIGVRAAKENLTAITCKIKITVTDSAANLKDNAALHFYIIKGSKSQEIDIFGSNHATDTKTNVAKAADQTFATGSLVSKVDYSSNATGQLTAELSFVVAQAATDKTLGTTSASDIEFFEIYAYVFGPDSDCTSAGTGTSVAFDMSFEGTQKSA